MFGCAGVMSEPVSDVRLEVPVTLRDVRIPVLVMLGCAAVARDPVIEEPDMRFEPSTAPLTIPTKRVAVTALVTPRDVRVPTEVILGCAAVTRDPVIAEPDMRLEPSTAPLTIPTKRVAVTALVTPSDVRVPSDVMLGCAGVMSEPVSEVRLEVPVTLREVSIPVLVILGCEAVARDPVIAEPDMRLEPSTAPLTIPTKRVAVTALVTPSDVRVPTKVILGCAGVMSEPVSDVRLEAPVTLRDVRIPVLVMLGCAAVAKDPVIAEPDMRFEPSTAPLRIPTKRVAVTALVTPSDVRVPTDVMLGCAGVVSEPVSDVRFEMPVTLREVRIPVLVMLGCAAVAKDPVIAEPEMRFEPPTAPLRIPTKRVAVTALVTSSDVRVPTEVILGCAGVMREPVSDVRFEMPVTLREVRIPVLVMFGCAAVARDPVIEEPEMRFEPSTAPFRIPTKRVAVTALVTSSDVRVPTEVILGCAGVMSEPVSDVRLEMPVTLREVRIPVLVMLGCEAVARDPVIAEPDMRFEPSTAPLTIPMKRVAVTVLVTPSDVRVPTDVILGCAGVMSEPVSDVRFEIPVTLRDDRVPTLVIFGCTA
jgi:hypothetical protein